MSKRLEEHARALIAELEQVAEDTGSEWPTPASLRATAAALARNPRSSDRAPIWRRAAQLLEEREAARAAQRPLRFPAQTVTAPSFSDNPARWAVWYLRTNGHIYREFRRQVAQMLDVRPGLALSADQVLHVIRWNSLLRADGDVVAINNNLSSLFARLLLAERPQYATSFSLRKSVWDDLPAREWEEVLLAFELLRADRRIK